MQSCLESAVANAAKGQNLELASRALDGALTDCAAAAASCVRMVLQEASETGLLPADAVATASAACALQPMSENTFLQSFVVLRSQFLVFLGWYNTIQLVVIPWVCLWMFSGSILSLARFARFQYQLLRISIDTLLLMVLFVLVSVEETCVLVFRRLRASFSLEFQRKVSLQQNLQHASTFAEYVAAEDALAGSFVQEEDSCGQCRRRPGKPRMGSEEEHLQRLSAELDALLAADPAISDVGLARLEPLLVNEAGGIDVGSIGEDYLRKLCLCIRTACQSRHAIGGSNGMEARQKLGGWLAARLKAMGQTALCLSGGGSLAMHHMGVCRFLLEEELMPRVISGVSGGAIVAGFLCMHTDEELLDHVLVPGIVTRHLPHRWFPHWWQELFNFLRLGVLVPTEDFENTCAAFFGTWTFEEAFERTRRPVTIVISSNFLKKLPACVMLNHMTTPRVTIASAVATSCAAIGIMSPRGLVTKDPVTGALTPFDILGTSFADGTFTTEVPKDYLRSCFGVARFLVSQVNPHVSSFLGPKEGVLLNLRSYFGSDLQQRARQLSEYKLLPEFFGQAMCQATKHLSQDFQESKAGVTVYPPNMGLTAVKDAVTNPSVQDMEKYIMVGQRMAWAKAQDIRAMMLLEAAVAKAVASLVEAPDRFRQFPASRDQPPRFSNGKKQKKKKGSQRRTMPDLSAKSRVLGA
eukprot:TRINITY_DN5355_c0_g6_i1.p1 TRINITY_DN5355_c0_g6~~TRINITY_DN5355_c0_g6_i1.p1  ORF type:complete len:695 (-),score=120.85 TRINITY_DN5355_c0_g6_i1:214-2298(-)